MEMRAHGHPSLLQALKRVAKYSSYIEKHSPSVKRSGAFFFSSLGLARPEVTRYRQRLGEYYSSPQAAKVLLLLPQTSKKPFHESREHATITNELQQVLGEKIDFVHVCTYAAPFGVVPTELDEIYPLSQNLIATPFDKETIEYVAKQTSDYIANTSYGHVILLRNQKVWKGKILSACKLVCKKSQVPLTVLREEDPWSKSALVHLVNAVQTAINPQ
jgi:7-cyano-7-deazaguanine tRNA-ribosyltransferase